MANNFFQKIKTEYWVFITACMFFTRIPMPVIKDYKPNYLQQSSKYFSFIGLLIGVASCLPIYLLNPFLGNNISILFSIATTILMTGAFHEDGFADSCDAFGGGWTKDKILTIMKDSRLGTYGVIGLIAVLSFKFCLLQSMLNILNLKTLFCICIAAHSVSRLSAVFMMQFLPYVQDIDVSKVKPIAIQKLRITEIIIAITGSCIPFLFINTIYLLVIIPIIPTFIYIKYYFNKWIGGYTGDCLGATQQIIELLVYLTAIILAKLT